MSLTFILLVRDYPVASFDLAKERFSGSVDLCPDCAFLLGPINAARADMDVLYLHQSDKGGRCIAGSMSQLAARSNLTVAETDWLQQNVVERLLQKFIRGLLRLRILRTTSALTLQLYNALARVRARRGIRIIARGHCVITDRLHAHILSVLIGRRNLLLDSSNGKVFAFHDAWTRGGASHSQSYNDRRGIYARARAIAAAMHRPNASYRCAVIAACNAATRCSKN